MAVEVNIHTTLGFLYDATVVGALLHGVALLQGWYYFRFNNKRDNWIIQSLVGITLFFSTFQVIFLCTAVYNYCISMFQQRYWSDFGSLTYLATLNKFLVVELIFSGLIAWIVQHFYVYRIYVLGKSYWLCLPPILMSWGSFLTLMIFVGNALNLKFFAELPRFNTLSVVTNILGMICDVGITLTTVLLLQRSKTGFKQTTNILNRLIIFSFNAGIPTTLCAILTVVLIYGAPGTFAYIFVYVTMARFFANSLLVTLNSRDQLKGTGSSGQGTDSAEKYTLHQRASHRVDLGNPPVESGGTRNLQIRVDETYMVKADNGSETEMDLAYKAARREI